MEGLRGESTAGLGLLVVVVVVVLLVVWLAVLLVLLMGAGTGVEGAEAEVGATLVSSFVALLDRFLLGVVLSFSFLGDFLGVASFSVLEDVLGRVDLLLPFSSVEEVLPFLCRVDLGVSPPLFSIAAAD